MIVARYPIKCKASSHSQLNSSLTEVPASSAFDSFGYGSKSRGICFNPAQAILDELPHEHGDDEQSLIAQALLRHGLPMLDDNEQTVFLSVVTKCFPGFSSEPTAEVKATTKSSPHPIGITGGQTS